MKKMDWCNFRQTLKTKIESEVHPHVPGERANYFRSTAFESTEVEYLDLIYALVRTAKPNLLLETGSHHGISSACMALALKENEADGAPRGLVVSIENSASNIEKATALAEKCDVCSYIRFIEAHAATYLAVDDSLAKFDIVFLDSTRTERVREFQILKERNRLSLGALIAFHDTSALRAKSIRSQEASQNYYLTELQKVAIACVGPITFSLSRGLQLFQFQQHRTSTTD